MHDNQRCVKHFSN